MASKSQMTGMLGVYLVAVELTKRGFIVSPTSRSAAGADLLVTDQDCCKAFSVQVKSDRTKSDFWLVGKKAKTAVSPTHIYVFVKIKNSVKHGESVDFYIVSSKSVEQLAYHEGKFPNIRVKNINKFKDRWKVFGDPNPVEG